MNKKTGFMCGTDFDTEIEGFDAYIFATEDLLKKKRYPCWQKCGIVKVSVEVIEEIYRPKSK